MSKKKTFKGLILPHDNPPRRSSLKRQLIFFDSLLMPSHDDIALVNDFEVTEKFPGAEIAWAKRTPFPRSDNYSDTIQEFQSETIALQKRGLLQFIPKTTHGLDPASNWTIYHSAISVPELVCAAASDASMTPPPIMPPNGVYAGGTMALGGHRSKYELPTHNPYNLQDVHEQWKGIAQGRLGRFIKFIRRSNFESAAPIALDPINSALLQAMNSDPVIATNNDKENLAQAVISMDVVDPVVLDKALVDMSWNDVLEIRRRILPRVSILRDEMIRSVSRVNPSSGSMSIYQQSINDMQDELNRYQDELNEAWSSLGIRGLLKGGGAIGLYGLGQNAGLAMLLQAVTTTQAINVFVCLGLISVAALSGEVKQLVQAGRKVKGHPLAFVDELPN